MREFYVYVYRDPSRQNEAIYVGKGKAGRAYKHLTRKDMHPFTQRLQLMKREGVEPHIEIINAIDEGHAYFMEECCIQVLGRKDLGKGTLLNLNDGGKGGQSGSKATNGSKGMTWWNNGIEQIMCEECPPGYVKGMLKHRK